MTHERGRPPAPPHWHIFREVAHGVKQYMLPIYSHQAQASAAAAALTRRTHRRYGAEACRYNSCHM
jgi:hypothetical protein